MPHFSTVVFTPLPDLQFLIESLARAVFKNKRVFISMDGYERGLFQKLRKRYPELAPAKATRGALCLETADWLATVEWVLDIAGTVWIKDDAEMRNIAARDCKPATSLVDLGELAAQADALGMVLVSGGFRLVSRAYEKGHAARHASVQLHQLKSLENWGKSGKTAIAAHPTDLIMLEEDARLLKERYRTANNLGLALLVTLGLQAAVVGGGKSERLRVLLGKIGEQWAADLKVWLGSPAWVPMAEVADNFVPAFLAWRSNLVQASFAFGATPLLMPTLLPATYDLDLPCQALAPHDPVSRLEQADRPVPASARRSTEGPLHSSHKSLGSSRSASTPTSTSTSTSYGSRPLASSVGWSTASSSSCPRSPRATASSSSPPVSLPEPVIKTEGDARLCPQSPDISLPSPPRESLVRKGQSKAGERDGEAAEDLEGDVIVPYRDATAVVRKGAVVDPSAHLAANVTVGRRARVESGAYIGRDVSVPEGLIIGAGAVVKKIDFSNSAHVAPGSRLRGDIKTCAKTRINVPCELGAGAYIGSGVVINARITISDGARIMILRDPHACLPDGTVVGGSLMLGEHCAVGQGVRFGAEVVLGDGVVIGDGVVVGDCVRIANNITIGDNAVITGYVRITSDVPAGARVGHSATHGQGCAPDAVEDLEPFQLRVNGQAVSPARRKSALLDDSGSTASASRGSKAAMLGSLGAGMAARSPSPVKKEGDISPGRLTPAKRSLRFHSTTSTPPGKRARSDLGIPSTPGQTSDPEEAVQTQATLASSAGETSPASSLGFLQASARPPVPQAQRRLPRPILLPPAEMRNSPARGAANFPPPKVRQTLAAPPVGDVASQAAVAGRVAVLPQPALPAPTAFKGFPRKPGI